MIRSAPSILFASCLLLAACGGSAAPEPDAHAPQAPADAPAGAATVADASREGLRERARELRESRARWWEDDALLESLGIAAAERAALRAAVQRGQQALDAASRGVAEANLAYRDALAAADLARAREAASRHAEQVRTLALARHLVVVEVLEGLPEAARRQLLERPGLLAALARGERTPAAERRPARAGRRGSADQAEADADPDMD